MNEVVRRIQLKVKRDAPGGALTLARKGARYVRELASAPFYLRGATHLGSGVRTLGAPRIDNRGTLLIGDHVLLRSVVLPVELVTEPGGTIEIGAESELNYGTSIGAHGRIAIGARARIGTYVMMMDTEYHDVYDRSLIPPPRPIVIEDDVWIGSRATILPGVRIGRGSIVSIGALVTRDVAPFTIVAGLPARPVRRLDPARFHIQGADLAPVTTSAPSIGESWPVASSPQAD